MVKLSKGVFISLDLPHLRPANNWLSHCFPAHIKEFWVNFVRVIWDDGRSCLQILNLDKFVAFGEPGMLQDLCGATCISQPLRRVLDEHFQAEVLELWWVAAPEASYDSSLLRPLHFQVNDPLDQETLVLVEEGSDAE